MAAVNPISREVVFKIVYYGPGLGGKTTTLEYLHATAKAEHRGKLVSLATPVDRTLYFDFLPVRLPRVRGMSVRLQLFTVPGQVYFNATRRLVLTGADGVVFVSDSQGARADANVESLDNLRENLTDQGKRVEDLPLVFQHNKRDLRDVMELGELDAMLNPGGLPSIGTSARTGDGVYEALWAITDRVLAAFEAKIPDSAAAGLRRELATIEGGIAGALRSAAGEAPRSVAAAVSRVAPPEAEWQGLAAHATLSDADLEPSASPGADVPARPSARAASAGLSFAELWPEGEQDAVRELEGALVARRARRVVELADGLFGRIVANLATRVGEVDDAGERALALAALGIEGRRYHAFRAVVRDARAGLDVRARDALEAFALVLQARIAKSGLK